MKRRVISLRVLVVILPMLITEHLSAQLGTPTLTAPANGSTVNVGNTVTFSWTAVSGATSYDVEWDAGTAFVSSQNVSGTSLNVVIQAASVGSHTWHVRARNATTIGTYSSTRTYTVAGATLGVPTLTAPANGSTVNVGNTVTFSWTAVSGATSYDVEWDAGTAFVSSQNVAGTSLSVTIQAASVGSHTWHVRARNATTIGTYSSTRTYTVAGATLGVPTLTAPANGSTVNVGNTVTFSWTAVSGATSYDVEWDAGTAFVSSQNVAGTSLSVTIQAASVGSHTWHVRARNATTIGTYSSTWTYTVAGATLGTPTLTAPANGSTVNVGNTVTFSWTAVSGATSYDVEWDAGTAFVSSQNVAGTSLSVTIQAASVGSHTWHVRARNATTIGTYSSTRTYTVAGATLGVPTLTAPANGSTVNVGNTVTFSWTAVSGATSYDVEWDAGTAFVSSQNVSGTSLNVVIQAASVGSHTWHVRARNATTIGTYSSTWTYTVAGATLGTPTLTAPANGSTVNVGNTVTFSWTAVSGATSYDVEWDAGTAFVSSQNVAGTSLSVTIQAASVGSHTWHVRARNATTIGTYSSTRTYTVAGATLGVPTLTAPANGSTVNVGNTVTFSWTAVSGATSYDVEWDASTAFVSSQNVAGTSLSVTIQAASVGSHTWHVRARNATTIGTYSSTWTYTVAGATLGTPTLTAPANGSTVNVGNTVTFSWTAVSGATSYDIEWDAGTSYVSSQNVSGTSLTITIQAGGIGSHTWHVRARNPLGVGGYSVTRSYTVPNPCSIVNKWYSQLDPLWRIDRMNGAYLPDGECQIERSGCAMTCLAMILSSQVGNQENDYTPKALNNYLNNRMPPGYSNSNNGPDCRLDWRAPADKDGPGAVTYAEATNNANSWAWLDAQLNQCRRVVVNVHDGNHWVLVVGKTAPNTDPSSYIVYDPGTIYANMAIQNLAYFKIDHKTNHVYNNFFNRGHSYDGVWRTDFPNILTQGPVSTATVNEYTTESRAGSDGYLITNISQPNQYNSGQSPIQLRIFPNPVLGNKVTVEFYNPSLGPVILEITDLMGRQIYHTQTIAPAGRNINQLPVETLANGMYLLTVRTETETVTKKFIINK